MKRPAHRDEEWPPLATTRESPRTETKTQHSQKKKKKNKYMYATDMRKLRSREAVLLKIITLVSVKSIKIELESMD